MGLLSVERPWTRTCHCDHSASARSFVADATEVAAFSSVNATGNIRSSHCFPGEVPRKDWNEVALATSFFFLLLNVRSPPNGGLHFSIWLTFDVANGASGRRLGLRSRRHLRQHWHLLRERWHSLRR
jgi:hypothetical protein